MFAVNKLKSSRLRHLPLKKIIKRLKKLIAVFLILCLLGVGYVFGVNQGIQSYADEYLLSPEDAAKLQDVDCILVLGAGIWGDALSPMLEDRVLTAVSLYESGVSDRLLMSGDHGSEDYDEVNAMKNYAKSKGVPADSIFMDHAGFSTYESMYRARDVFIAKRIVIVSQQYHLYRAVFDARRLGLEAYGVSADLRDYGSYTDSYNSTREILARNKDFLMCLIKPEPTYLGDTVPISGSGAQTDDKIS